MMAEFKKILNSYEDESQVDPYLIDGKYYYRDAAEISKLHHAHYEFIMNIIICIGVVMLLVLFFNPVVSIIVYLFFMLPMAFFMWSIGRKSVKYDDISYEIWLKEMKYFSCTSKIV